MSKQQKLPSSEQSSPNLLDLGGIIEQLFKPDKTFTDPVWRDIIANHLEVVVIDTESFQRLSGLRQLGPTHLIFRGALHTRFDHSLGVLHCTQELLDRIEDNPHKEGRLEDLYVPSTEEQLKTKIAGDEMLTGEEMQRRRIYRMFFLMVVRLAALIHDLPNVPFSHTLDDEANLLVPQWENQTRVETIFAINGSIFKAIRDCILKARKETRKEGVVKDEDVDSLCKSIIGGALGVNMAIERLGGQPAKDAEAKGAGDFIRSNYSTSRGFPFSLDENSTKVGAYVVGNTICADLIDYTARDFYFTGINERVDLRFTRYAIIANADAGQDSDSGHPVLAFRVCKPSTKELKLPILTGLTNMIHKRFILRQLVHFHHTKIAFSAMVSEAVNFYLDAQQLVLEEKKQKGPDPAKTLENYLLQNSVSDDGLVNYLCGASGMNVPETVYLAEKYRLRKPYRKLVYGWRGRTRDILDETPQMNTWKQLRTEPRLRAEVEKKLSEWADFLHADCSGTSVEQGPKSKVILFIPSEPERLYKDLRTYIQYYSGKEARVRRLDSIEENEWSTIPTIAPIVQTLSTNLKTNYASLWEAIVFVTPDYCPFPDGFESELSKLLDLVMTPQSDAHAIEEEQCRIKGVDATKVRSAMLEISRKMSGPGKDLDWYRGFPSPTQVT